MTLPSYLPKPVHINVGITVTYHSNAIDFTACCSIHKYSYVSMRRASQRKKLVPSKFQWFGFHFFSKIHPKICKPIRYN